MNKINQKRNAKFNKQLFKIKKLIIININKSNKIKKLNAINDNQFKKY